MHGVVWSKRALLISGAIGLGSLALLVGGLWLGGVGGGVLAGAGLLVGGLLLYAVLRLRRVDTSDWLISWDIPEALQLSGYIGQQEGFSFVATGTPGSAAEREWRGWWQALPDRLFRYQAQLDDLFRSNPDLPPLELWRAVGAAEPLEFDPPDFDALAEQPALRALCRRHWPGFERAWQAEKPLLIGKMRQQGRAVREEQIVRACVRAADKRTSAPFFLRLDFVRWPETHQQQRSPQHIMLGARYLEPGAAEQLRAIIAAAVTRLV